MFGRLNRFRVGQGGKVRSVLGAAIVLAVVISPFAVAQTSGLIGGKRNPRSGAFDRETKVIATNDTWGMRYSNRTVGGGGGVLFGCRSEPGGTPQRNFPCMRSRNVADGLAFEMVTGGPIGGTISVGRGGDNAKPFTTNATGVASGLNAERVGSRTAAELTSDAVSAVQGSLSIARVNAAGAALAARGVESVGHPSTGTYTVKFGTPVNACALTATQSASGTDVGPVGTQLGADNRTVTVTTLSLVPTTELADRAFDISAVC
jgi:hypothetical protein